MPGYSANSRSPERNNPKMTLVEETAWSVVVVSTTTVALTGSMASRCCTLGKLGAANGGGRTTSGQSHGHAKDQKNAFHALKVIPCDASFGHGCGVFDFALVSPQCSWWHLTYGSLHRFPPHASNMTYGYRTRRSMASTEAWDHAQARSFRVMRDWTIWMVLWTPLAQWRWGGESAILVMSGLLTLGVMLPLVLVERELKQGPPYTSTRRRSRHRIGCAVSCCCCQFSGRSPTTVQNRSAKKPACCPLWVGARPAPMCFCAWRTTNAITTSTGGWRWASTRSGGQRC